MLTAFLIFLFYAARAAQADLGWDGLDRFVATITSKKQSRKKM